MKNVEKPLVRTFKKMKLMHNYQHLVQYKQAQAKVRKVIRTAKRKYWKEFCGSIGRSTQISEVWGMIKRREGRSNFDLSAMKDGDRNVITNAEKAEEENDWFTMEELESFRKNREICSRG